MPILRKSGFQSISPPTPQISRPLEASRGPGIRSSSIAFLQPDVDVEQAAAAARRRVAALERQPAVGRRQERDVFDRILDVQVGQLRDVEVSGVKMRLDQARQDRAAAGVDPPRIGRRAGAPCAGPA